MAGYRNRILVACRINVLMKPKVSHNFLLNDSEFRPFDTDLRLVLPAIEDGDSRCSARQWPRPDLLVASLPNLFALFSEFVLIHCDHFAVCENCQRCRRHATKIVAG